MLGKLTNSVIDTIVEECRRQENQERIKTHVIDPLICYVLDRLYPYIFLTATVFILILLVAIIILFLIIRANYKQ